MIIVDRHRKIITVLLKSLIILLLIFHVLKDWCLVIKAEIKGKVITDIACNTAVTVVESSFHKEGVLTVVHKAKLM